MAFEERIRLLREKWPNADYLAQELYLILENWDNNGMGPLTLRPKGSMAPLTIYAPTGGGSVMDVPQTDGSKIGLLPDFSAIQSTPAADVVTPNPATTTTPLGGSSGGSGGILGTVVSGTGSTYQVTRNDTGAVVTVTHPQIDSAETIPAGRIIALFLVNGSFFTLEPTWL